MSGVFQKNCILIVSGTHLTDHIFGNKLCEKYDSVALFRSVMRETLRFLECVLRTKYDNTKNCSFLATHLEPNKK